MMKLGLFLKGGHHVAAWRDPSADPRARQSLTHHVDIARIAELGKFDILLMADINSRRIAMWLSSLALDTLRERSRNLDKQA